MGGSVVCKVIWLGSGGTVDRVVWHVRESGNFVRVLTIFGKTKGYDDTRYGREFGEGVRALLVKCFEEVFEHCAWFWVLCLGV